MRKQTFSWSNSYHEDKPLRGFKKVDAYITYAPVYTHIRKDPRLTSVMHNDPGYKWLGKITFIIFALFVITGNILYFTLD